MWTDKQIIDFLKKIKNGLPNFIEDTKLGFLVFMFVLGSVIILITKLVFNYFGTEYQFWYGMLGLMVSALLFAIFDPKHKEKKWW